MGNWSWNLSGHDSYFVGYLLGAEPLASKLQSPLLPPDFSSEPLAGTDPAELGLPLENMYTRYI